MDLPGRPSERDENVGTMGGRNVSHRLFHSPRFHRTARRIGPYLFATLSPDCSAVFA
jgi:hypothetical protein